MYTFDAKKNQFYLESKKNPALKFPKCSYNPITQTISYLFYCRRTTQNFMGKSVHS